MYPSRILDVKGVTLWEGMMWSVMPSFHFTIAEPIPDDDLLAFDLQEILVEYERCLPPADGGPLYIYRARINAT